LTVLSTAPSLKRPKWNFRILATRPILVKAKNDHLRKAVAIDLIVDLPFAFEVAKDVSIEKVEVEKRFSAMFKVYTSKNFEDVDSEHVEFFAVLDVDQKFEDFVKAYWMYPNHIAFEVAEIEPL